MLFCIGTGGYKKADQYFVYERFTVIYRTEMKGMRGLRFKIFSTENLVDNTNGIGAGKADNSNGAGAGGGGQRHDCIIFKILLHRANTRFLRFAGGLYHGGSLRQSPVPAPWLLPSWRYVWCGWARFWRRLSS